MENSSNITARLKPEARLNNIYHFPPSTVKPLRHPCGPMTRNTQYRSLHPAVSFLKLYVFGSAPHQNHTEYGSFVNLFTVKEKLTIFWGGGGRGKESRT